MFEELTKSIKAQLYDRVSSPFIGSYVISWCLYNYHVILTAFSNIAPAKRIQQINDLMDSPENYTFLAPLCLSVFYVMIWPIIERCIYRWYKIQQLKLKELQVSFESRTPFTDEEARKLFFEQREAQKELEVDLKVELEKSKRLSHDLDSAMMDHAQAIKVREEKIVQLEGQVSKLTAQAGEAIVQWSDARDQIRRLNTFINTDPALKARYAELLKFSDIDFQILGYIKENQPTNKIEFKSDDAVDYDKTMRRLIADGLIDKSVNTGTYTLLSVGEKILNLYKERIDKSL